MRGKQKLSQSDYILRCTRYFHNDAKWRQQSSTVENERCSINTSIRFLGNLPDADISDPETDSNDDSYNDGEDSDAESSATDDDVTLYQLYQETNKKQGTKVDAAQASISKFTWKKSQRRLSSEALVKRNSLILRRIFCSQSSTSRSTSPKT
jgi:hypothetical protein